MATVPTVLQASYPVVRTWVESGRSVPIVNAPPAAIACANELAGGLIEPLAVESNGPLALSSTRSPICDTAPS